MIQDLMRKHKSKFLWAILILIIIPFVFWGGDFGTGGGRDAADRLQTDPIAMVAGAPVAQAHFRMALSNALQQQRMYNPDARLRDLHESGAAMQILENIVNDMILSQEATLTDYTFDREFLEEQLRNEARFQEDGQFSPRLFNAWVEDNINISWNAEYERIAHNEARKLLIEKIIAGARVPESEVRQEFENRHTEISVRYAPVAPEVEPTEQEISDFYAENTEHYQNPEQMKAEIVVISLEAPRPALVDELVIRARAGEDFATLAGTYSEDAFSEKGGDMGWQARTATTPAHLLPAFDLAVGEVTDATQGPGGYYIHKLEEERTSEISGERDVRLRQILIRPTLPEEEKARRVEQARALAEKAGETGDLAAAAAEAGLAVQQTDFFSTASLSVENVHADDTWQFRAGVGDLPLETVSDPIEARQNVYVARITEVLPATPQPLAEVREQLERDAAMAARRSEPYLAKVSEMTANIEENAERLADLATLYPELLAGVQLAAPFSVAGYQMSSPPFWRPQDVFDAATKAGRGKIAGPVMDMMGTTYFIELLSLTPPDQEVWDEKFEEEREGIQDQLLQLARRDRLEDYFRERRLALNWQFDQAVYDEVLGLNFPEEAEAETADEAEDAEADDKAAETTEEPVVTEEPVAAQPDAATDEESADAEPTAQP